MCLPPGLWFVWMGRHPPRSTSTWSHRFRSPRAGWRWNREGAAPAEPSAGKAPPMPSRRDGRLGVSLALPETQPWNDPVQRAEKVARIVSVFTGRISPFSVMIPAINEAGVTSKAGL